MKCLDFLIEHLFDIKMLSTVLHAFGGQAGNHQVIFVIPGFETIKDCSTSHRSLAMLIVKAMYRGYQITGSPVENMLSEEKDWSCQVQSDRKR